VHPPAHASQHLLPGVAADGGAHASVTSRSCGPTLPALLAQDCRFVSVAARETRAGTAACAGAPHDRAGLARRALVGWMPSDASSGRAQRRCSAVAAAGVHAPARMLASRSTNSLSACRSALLSGIAPPYPTLPSALSSGTLPGLFGRRGADRVAPKGHAPAPRLLPCKGAAGPATRNDQKSMT